MIDRGAACPRRLPQPPDGAVWGAGFVAMPVTPGYPARVSRRDRTVTFFLRDDAEAAEAERLIDRARAAFDALAAPLAMADAQPLAAALLEAATQRAAMREALCALRAGLRADAERLLAAFAAEGTRP